MADRRTSVPVFCGQRGFTLLELIIVVFLIALTTGFISTRLSHNVGREVEQEAHKFAALVNYCKEEAVVSSEPMAIFIDQSESRFVFLRLGETDWEEIRQDDILRPRTAPEPVEIKIVKLAKNAITRDSKTKSKASDNKKKKKSKNPYKNAPLIVVDALGRLSPFEVAFYFEDSEFRVKPGDDGRAHVSQRNDDDEG